jgi:hypothetical protein
MMTRTGRLPLVSARNATVRVLLCLPQIQVAGSTRRGLAQSSLSPSPPCASRLDEARDSFFKLEVPHPLVLFFLYAPSRFISSTGAIEHVLWLQCNTNSLFCPFFSPCKPVCNPMFWSKTSRRGLAIYYISLRPSLTLSPSLK